MQRLSRVLLGVGLSLVLATAVQAQIALGVRAGYNNSTLSVEEDGVSSEDFNSRSGFHGGVDLAVMFGPMFGVEVGGQYSQKGATGDFDGTDVTLKIDYIDVPVVFAVNVPTNSQIAPRFFAGGVASFEASCKLAAGSISADCSDEDIGARKSMYVAGIFGAGIAVAAGPGSFIVQGDYQLGLTNMSDEVGVDAKVNVIQGSVGYRFPIGGSTP
jgi:hypothetical protein